MSQSFNYRHLYYFWVVAKEGGMARAAERLDMAQELMLRKKTLEALVKSGYPDGPYQLPDSLRGWRRELMGQALLDSLATAGEQP